MLQRELPRPQATSVSSDPQPMGPVGADPKQAADALLAAEMNALLQHEAAAYPAKKRKRGAGGPSLYWNTIYRSRLMNRSWLTP